MKKESSVEDPFLLLIELKLSVSSRTMDSIIIGNTYHFCYYLMGDYIEFTYSLFYFLLDYKFSIINC